MALSSNEWAAQIAKRVGQRVAHYRAQAPGEKTKQGITAQALADRCTALGMPMDRTVIAKLEKGTRQTITVGEVIVLARALGVPPIELLFPVGRVEETEVLPGTSVATWDALTWFTGERDSLPTDDGTSQNVYPMQWHREHEQLIDDWGVQRRELEASLTASGYDKLPAAPDDPGRLLIRLKEEALRHTEASLRDLRAGMRKMGLTPPSLGDLASYIEPESSPGETPPGPAKGDPS